MGTFKHFYHRNYDDRMKLISEFAGLDMNEKHEITSDYHQSSDNLVENYVTDYSIPEGVAVNFMINGVEKIVPMVTEEPSVIAAASNGARLFSKGAGITAEVLGRNLMGQIVVKTNDINLLIGIINTHQGHIIDIANQSHPSILEYGGGAKKVRVRKLDNDYASVDLFVNVGEAMGANIINSMLEATSQFIEERTNCDVLMSILSNYGEDNLVKVSGSIPFSQLGNPDNNGSDVAQRIVEASHIAQIDPYRAATHNKGIMNGIDAVVMAMGNDWRAVEAGIHSYASKDGQYKGLSNWTIDGDNLVGEMTIPLSLAFIGGAVKVLSKVKINQHLSQVTSKEELSQVVASVGLAQNLAALRALVTDGIQKGHMNLQLNSLVMSAGAKDKEINQVVSKMRANHLNDLKSAQKILNQIRNNNEGEF
ncbi:hydroxymethylglutaryl-CoA reductase, degradative [Apilactobacillus kunkeei]|uniref:hydroxymethylglutaryl-CoA reductase, degradative n=1 Tax=Apilactobacillus kunkeei TaxID=148814 RepID=UPI00110CB378|nr:hydroxymethylglutaryl-CoA reductase, degradative [Apilactobacillus kunkeei]TMT01831.1 hydroxymethylglutaryl-CoA reductase, degradative [Apilactobacillus kunkeei]